MTEQEAMALVLARLRAEVEGELAEARQTAARLVDGLRQIFGHCDLGRIADWKARMDLEHEARQMVYHDYLKQTIDIRQAALEAAAAKALEVSPSKAEGERVAAAIRGLQWK